jgi:hypothetical protein
MALVVLAHGCATGVSVETGAAGSGGAHTTTSSGGGGTGAAGGSAGSAGAGATAGGGGSGGSGQCDDVVDGECLQGYALGNVAPAGSTQGPVAQVPNVGISDWYVATFTPTGPASYGGGTPRITFAVNTNGIYVFDIAPDCVGGSSPGCDEGGVATGVDDWSFVDNQSTAGASQWSTRDEPWPATVYVRVYRTTGTGCEDYQLTVTR